MASSAPSPPTLYILNRVYSSWSLRAWLAMRHLKIDFDTELLLVGTPEVPDLGSPESNELLSRAGPTGKVPALHVPDGSGGKHIVFESLAIMEFLAEGKKHTKDRADFRTPSTRHHGMSRVAGSSRFTPLCSQWAHVSVSHTLNRIRLCVTNCMSFSSFLAHFFFLRALQTTLASGPRNVLNVHMPDLWPQRWLPVLDQSGIML